LVRTAALRAVSGFDEALIAGEEPELCFRLRRQGFRILRIAADMALHDAAMVRFAQWWKRTERGGHAFAELGATHPGLFRRENRSIIFWGFVLPAAAFLSISVTGGLGLVLLMAYPALVLRILARRCTRGDALRDASLFAAACVIGKLPEVTGMGRYWWSRMRGRRNELIEYK
jgi:hypothetical protein